MKELNEKYSLPSEYADFIGLSYSKLTSDKHKKDNGQYFTPKLISDFMANLAKPNLDKISILDPGCGTAILSCSLIEKLVSNSNVKEIDLTLYETDKSVVIQTKSVVDLSCKLVRKEKLKIFHVQ
jgi:adenine-specific DNA-methyltransferase